MKNFLKISLFFLLFLMVSCNTSQSKISEVENLVKEMKSDKKKYTDKDWNKSDTIILRLENDLEINRDNYNPEQIEKANNLIGQYKALTVKRELNNFKRSINDIKQQLNGALNVFKDSISN